MSETNKHLIADLRTAHRQQIGFMDALAAVDDRLRALDATNVELNRELTTRYAEIEAAWVVNQRFDQQLKDINDALPPCPTCGGKQQVWNDPATDPLRRHFHIDCPDCDDGKVSIPWLVATFNAVHDLLTSGDVPKSWRLCAEYLRSVKP